MNDDQTPKPPYYVLKIARASGELETHVYPTRLHMRLGFEALEHTMKEGDVARLFVKRVAKR